MRIVSLFILLASIHFTSTATELIQNGDFQDPVFSGTAQNIAYTSWTENGPGDANGSGSNNLIPGGAYNQVLRLPSSRYGRQDINVAWTAEHKFLLTFNAKEAWWRGSNTGDQVWVTIRDVNNVNHWASGKVNLDGTHAGSQGDWLDYGGNTQAGAQSYRYVIYGADLIANGMTAGQTLRLNFANGGNSVIHLDNISLKMTEPNKGNFIFTGGSSGGTPVTLPYESDFEIADGYSVGPLYSDNWWQLDLGLDTNIFTPGAASPQALDFFGGEGLSLLTDSSSASVSWVDFFIKPVYVDDEELSVADFLELMSAPRSTTTGFIRVQNNSGLGELYVADGSTGIFGADWVFTGIEQQLDGDTAIDWLRLTYRIDFTAKRWDLFVDTEMVVTDLGFLDTSLTELSSITILSDDNDPTQLDYFYAGNTNPLYTDTSNDGLPDDWLVAQGLDINVNQREGDPDGDSLVNLHEYQIGTRADLADTDSDGVDDDVELDNGLDPTVDDAALDPDGDWLTNIDELSFGLDPFVDDVAGVVGLVPRDVWLSVGGGTTRHLTNLSSFPSGFDQRLWLTELTIPSSESLGDNYGQRIHGQLVAPETADYTFWIAGDNKCELWLSSDSNPFSKQLIASVDTWTNYQQWQKYASQQSVTISLEAGQSYYFEVIHKEISGGDHIAVAWAYGSTSRAVIDGQYLQVGSTHTNDQDDDGLPDDWEQTVGLDANSGSALDGFWGDSDGDGLLNYQEYQAGGDASTVDTDGDGMDDLWEFENGLLVGDASDADLDADGDGIRNLEEFNLGLDPNVVDSVPLVRRDAWTGLNGNSISVLVDSDLFPGQPNQTSLISDLDIPQSESLGDNYGQRIYGLIVAPEDGDYVFWLSGDNACEFWLSSSSSAYDKERIAFLTGWAAYGDWEKSITQQSVRIPLEAGQSYFFEILHKEGTGEDHVSVAWKYGSNSRAVITDQNLLISPYQAGDDDQDGLLDAWELANGLDASKGYGVDGYAGDFDGDGLLNYEERNLGTDPTLADTDGDGYGDYEEIKNIYSDALVADLSSTPQLVQTVDGASFESSRGSWGAEGSEIYSMDSVGGLTYILDFPAADAYRVVVTIAEQNSYKTNDSSFSLATTINDVSYGTRTTTVPNGQSAELSYYLPYMSAGQYTLGLDWFNGFGNSYLRVKSIRVESLSDVDLDSNGIADWIETRSTRTSGVVTPLEVYTSPYCLQGTSFAPTAVVVNSHESTTPGVVRAEVAKQALSNGFYADITLVPDEQRVVAVDDQGVRTIEQTLVWEAFNAFEHDFLHIRLDDSMLLTAFDPVATVGRPIELKLLSPDNVEETYNLAAEATLQALFDQVGDWQITATLLPVSSEDPIVLNSVIRVSSASFQSQPILLDNITRSWSPSISDGHVVLDADPSVLLYEPSPGALPRNFEVGATEIDSRVVARLYEDGPILAVTELDLVYNYTRTQTSNSIVKTFPDGTQLVSAYILLSEVPDDLFIKIHSYKSGIVFDDGTYWRELTADDFDENGRYQFFMLRSPSIVGGTCHWFKVYQDGQFVGGS